MNDGTYHDKAEAFAAALVLQAAWPVLLVTAGLIAAPIIGLGGPRGAAISLVAWLLAAASGAAVIAFSALLVFDAWLFRLMASHASEAGGAAAVDDVLVRMRLKPTATAGRTLDQRIAGTSRLLMRQRLLLVLFVAAFVVAFR